MGEWTSFVIFRGPEIKLNPDDKTYLGEVADPWYITLGFNTD